MTAPTAAPVPAAAGGLTTTNPSGLRNVRPGREAGTFYSDAPECDSLDHLFDKKDTWKTEAALDSTMDIVGLHPKYAKADAEGRALILNGMPKDASLDAVYEFLKPIGRVVTVPILISMPGESTFWWVIMATKADVEKIYAYFRDEQTVLVRRATSPGHTIHMNDPNIFLRAKDIPVEQETHIIEGEPPTVHGHPSPPALAKTSQEPQAENTTEKPKKKKETVEKSTPTRITNRVTSSGTASTNKQTLTSPTTVRVAVPDISTTSIASRAPVTPIVTVTPPEPEPAPAAASPLSAKSPPFVPIAASWARIAGAANPSTGTVNIQPRTFSGHRLHPVGRIPTPVYSEPPEPQTEQMRIVFLLQLPTKIGLQEVSDGVKEGPLVGIRFGIDASTGARYAGVIFQYAKDAETFQNVLLKENAEDRPDRFGCKINAVRAEPFPMNDTIKAMANPEINASRRLTLVKRGFFFAVKETDLRRICLKVIGEEGIQMIFLYNGGNGTIIFAEVGHAMKVKTELERLAAAAARKDPGSASCWEGLLTTYSKDPCAHPLMLQTVLRD